MRGSITITSIKRLPDSVMFLRTIAHLNSAPFISYMKIASDTQCDFPGKQFSLAFVSTLPHLQSPLPYKASLLQHAVSRVGDAVMTKPDISSP